MAPALVFTILLAFVGSGCKTQHEVKTQSVVEVKPIEVQPIHITVDVNLRIERELEEFFSDIDQDADAK
jgi:hypothetical protein